MDLLAAFFDLFRGKRSPSPLSGDPPPPLTDRQEVDERRKLAALEPSTSKFAKEILEWARSQGLRASLGETYRSEASQAAIDPGRTAITPGKIGWHQVGRAFHLVIVDEKGKLDRPAYKTVGDEVDARGGVWLGRHPINTPKGPVTDLAHFEYHPGLKLSSFRSTPQARKELASAERRAARYG